MEEQPVQNQPPVEPESDSRHPAVIWFRKNALVIIGFVGWYLVNGAFWGLQGSGSEAGFANICAFPLNLGALILFALIKPTRKLALGILIALGVNFFLSLIVGLTMNGVCFVPFFNDVGF